jgi:hypothetical protein
MIRSVVVSMAPTLANPLQIEAPLADGDLDRSDRDETVG